MITFSFSKKRCKKCCRCHIVIQLQCGRLLLRCGLLRPLRPLRPLQGCMQGSNAGEKMIRPRPSRGLLLLRSGLLRGRGCSPTTRVGCRPAAGCRRPAADRCQNKMARQRHRHRHHDRRRAAAKTRWPCLAVARRRASSFCTVARDCCVAVDAEIPKAQCF